MITHEEWVAVSRLLKKFEQAMLNNWQGWTQAHEDLRIWLQDNVGECPYMMLIPPFDGKRKNGCGGVFLDRYCSFQFDLSTGLATDVMIPYLYWSHDHPYLVWLEFEDSGEVTKRVAFEVCSIPRDNHVDLAVMTPSTSGVTSSGFMTVPYPLNQEPISTIGGNKLIGLTGNTVEIKEATYDPLNQDDEPYTGYTG